MLILLVAHLVEDEELRLGTDVARVGDAASFEVRPRPCARCAADRAMNVFPVIGSTMLAMTLMVGLREERIEPRRVGVGHRQHVRFVDAHPAADRRAIESKPLVERVRVQMFDGEGAVLPAAEHVDEFQVHHLGFVLLGQREEVIGRHRTPPEGGASIADLSIINAVAPNLSDQTRLASISYCRTLPVRDIIYPLCARPPSPEPNSGSGTTLPTHWSHRLRERTDRPWDLQHLPKPPKASATGRWPTESHTPPAVKAAERLRQSLLQRQGAAGAVAEAGVSRAARDDHPRRAARCLDGRRRRDRAEGLGASSTAPRTTRTGSSR